MAKQTITTITEVKTFRCSDGKVYDNIDEAEAHEAEIQDPIYSITERVRQQEIDLANAINRIKVLEDEVKALKYSKQWFGPAAVLNGKQAEDFIDKLFGGTK